MKKKVLAFLITAAMVVGTMACGNSNAGSETSTATDTEPAQTETAETQTDSAEQTDDEVLKAAIANIENSTGTQSEWYGPTDGPKAAENKSIVMINANSANPSEAAWGDAVKAACDRIGWDCSVLDGKGTTQGQIEAFSQAISVGAGAIGNFGRCGVSAGKY